MAPKNKFWQRRDERFARIAAANAALAGMLPPWPQPRCLDAQLEMVVAREISERPLHGVPSVYRAECDVLATIFDEKLRMSAPQFERTLRVTFLSVADQAALNRRIFDRRLPPSVRLMLAHRLNAHVSYRGAK